MTVNTLNWPLAPGATTNIDTGAGETFAQQMADLEAAMSFMNANSTAGNLLYNASVSTLKLLINMGNSYSSWTAAQQAEFKNVIGSMNSGSSGSTMLNDIVKNVMMGSFYSNGASGFAATNTFITGLAGLLKALAPISNTFEAMYVSANATVSNITADEADTKDWEVTYNGVTYLTNGPGLTGTMGTIYDFNHFLQGAETQLYTDITTANPKGSTPLSAGSVAYYTAGANAIMDLLHKGKINVDQALMLMLMLLSGNFNDFSRIINGLGGQLNNLSTDQNNLAKLLGDIRSLAGAASGAGGTTSKAFMQALTQLQQMVNVNFPSLAPTITSSIQSILAGTYTMTSNTTKIPNSNYYSIGPNAPTPTTTGQLFNFTTALGAPPYGLPPGVSIIVTQPGGQPTLVTAANAVQYLPAGSTVQLGTTTSTATPYAIPVSVLGSTDTVDGLAVNYGIGDYTNLAAYLGTSLGTGANGVTQTLLGEQTTLASPSSEIQTGITTDTSTNSTFQATWQDGTQVFTNLEQQINTNAGKANQ